MRLKVGVLSFIAVLLLLAARRADAHGYIIRIIPANRSVFERPPTRIQAWFSEPLEPRFSGVSLTDERGQPVELVDSGVVEANRTQLSARIPQKLPDGLYVITLRVAFASDGHVFTERVTFSVGVGIGDIAAGEARNADPFEVLWRAIALPALSTSFGLYLLYQLVLLPGWGNPKYPAGLLPPRVMRPLNTAAWTAILAAFIGTVLAVIQQSAVLFNVSPGAVIRDNLWSTVLNGTQIGDTLKLRLIFIGLMGAIQYATAYFAERLPILVAPLWATNVAVAALALGTISLSSHATGADLWPLPSVITHWIHILANSAWVGGLVGLAFVIPPATSTLAQADRRAATLAALRRFSSVGVVAVLLMGATGLYNAAIQIRQPNEITTTAYGLTLAAKALLVVPLLLLAAYHHALASEDWLARALRRLRLSQSEPKPAAIRLESAFGIFVLLAAAVLAATPPPAPPPVTAEPPTLTANVQGYAISLAIDPGSKGVNSYTVQVARGGAPISSAEVWLRFTFPSLDLRTRPLRLDDSGDGAYLNAGAELDRAGAYSALVDVIPPGAAQAIRAAFDWPLPDVVDTPGARTPGVLNWLSAGAILAVFSAWGGYALGRWIGAVRQRLKLQPESVIIGVVISLATIAALIVGGFVIAGASQRMDALRNPPPRVVNPVIADAESLTAGRAAYREKCADCHGSAGESGRPALRSVVESRRDEEIYSAVLNGIGSMSAVPMEERAIWDVINYLRSAAFYRER